MGSGAGWRNSSIPLFFADRANPSSAKRCSCGVAFPHVLPSTPLPAAYKQKGEEAVTLPPFFFLRVVIVRVVLGIVSRIIRRKSLSLCVISELSIARCALPLRRSVEVKEAHNEAEQHKQGDCPVEQSLHSYSSKCGAARPRGTSAPRVCLPVARIGWFPSWSFETRMVGFRLSGHRSGPLAIWQRFAS